jgi:hypothetical protein
LKNPTKIEEMQQKNLFQKLNHYTLPFNTLNAKLKPFCHLLALLGTHPILHVSRIGVKRQITEWRGCL